MKLLVGGLETIENHICSSARPLTACFENTRLKLVNSCSLETERILHTLPSSDSTANQFSQFKIQVLPV